ncbi:MAG: Gfo/Idh/MocA family protein [Terriglobales bacterium]
MSARPRKLATLVVGAGSIGWRHLSNLRALGVEPLAACDPDAGRRERVARELEGKTFADLEHSLDEFRPQAVLVCTPPVCHVDQARHALACGAHVFIEKPLSHSEHGVDELLSQGRGRVVQVGYNLRHHPGLQHLKQQLDAGAIGRVLWARAEFGQYLPDWRPQQDYRLNYTAQRALGGGMLLDGSHEIDYTLWLLGEPLEVSCLTGKVSNLEMDVEDCADLLLRFAGGTQACVHLDCVQRRYSRGCKLAGTEGTLEWDYTENQVRLYRVADKRSVVFTHEFEANQMYVAELLHFLDSIEHGQESLSGLVQARQTLKVVLAARASAAAGRRIRLA